MAFSCKIFYKCDCTIFRVPYSGVFKPYSDVLKSYSGVFLQKNFMTPHTEFKEPYSSVFKPYSDVLKPYSSVFLARTIRKVARHLSFFTIFLLAKVPWTSHSWISWFSPSKVLWDHSSISSFPTKGTWPFVVVSSVNPLGLPPFFARLSYGYHSSTLFLGPLSWVIFTLSKVYSFLLLLLGFCLFFTVL